MLTKNKHFKIRSCLWIQNKTCMVFSWELFFCILSARHHNNKAIIIFAGFLETTRWYLVAICTRTLPSKGEYHHWPPTHLEVYVSDPLHYSVTCPNNGVPVLVLTFGPLCLQGLRKHNTQLTAQALMWRGGDENTEVGEGWRPAGIMHHPRLLRASSNAG